MSKLTKFCDQKTVALQVCNVLFIAVYPHKPMKCNVIGISEVSLKSRRLVAAAAGGGLVLMT